MSKPELDQKNEMLSDYYQCAASWAEDRQDEIRKSRRTAWIVALCALVIAALETCALIILLPLKTIIPYTILVDSHTGYITLLDPAKPIVLKSSTALTQSLLAQYVTARESLDISSITADYRKVMLWSAGSASSEYLGLMQPNNKANPFRLYPRTTVVETKVKSVTMLTEQSALVRFDTDRHDVGRKVDDISNWVAVINFRFSGVPMRIEDRFQNPLGFQVTSYRKNLEAPPTSSFGGR